MNNSAAALLNYINRTCQCDNPIIRCGNRGCRCVTCGLAQRQDWAIKKSKWSKPTIHEMPYSPRIEEHLRSVFEPSSEFVTVHAEF